MKDISRQLQNLENSNHIQILQKLENHKLNLSMPSVVTASFPVGLNSAYRGDTLASLDAKVYTLVSEDTKVTLG